MYLTASPEVRARAARRRARPRPTSPAIAADLERRDRLDSSRAESPLAQAGDAIELDTTDLGVDEVIERLVDMAMTAID